MKLAELYEIMDEPRKAMELVYQVIDSRKRHTNQPEATPTPGTVPQPQGASLFEENHASKLKLQLPDLRPRMLYGDAEVGREWMTEAEKLAEMFRKTRNLFVTMRVIGWVSDYDFKGKLQKRRIQRRDDTDEDRMASRLKLNEHDKHTRRAKDDGQPSEKVDSSHGVIFSRWLRVLMQRTLSAAVKTMSMTSTVFKKRGLDKEEPVFIGSSWRERFGQNCWMKGKLLDMLGSEDLYTPDHKPSQYPESKLLNLFFVRAWTDRLEAIAPLSAIAVTPGFCYSQQ
ncbi:hypothetical protein EV702DRAFT_1044784 [Suillus placidus]|uniref:Uncharacterized protein n=1 Tax=Suillus placidus TaxID=48579 RepID=A0A9P6ZWY8_9AGAM|nr:hypothetical protein EV702DRAFT_1044784 [Suillus placidus]